MQIHCLLSKTDIFKHKKIAQVNLAIFLCLHPFTGFALDVESGRVEPISESLIFKGVKEVSFLR
jgi:hypothetical protein